MPTFVEEYRVIDKSAWGPGPWQDEPDKVVWVDQATNLDCMAVRNECGGNWCGYVAVPEGHPAHGKEYDDVEAHVHGGLTYSGLCRAQPWRPTGGICHIEQPGRPERVYWLGFDCAHGWDMCPGTQAIQAILGDDGEGGTYRSLDYVVAQCESLAEQLARMA